MRELEQAILRQDTTLDLATLPTPARSILVIALEGSAFEALPRAYAPLARPERELILAPSCWPDLPPEEPAEPDHTCCSSTPPELLTSPILQAILTAALSDVAVLVGREPMPGPLLVPFVGAEHDWTAIELPAWLAGSWNVPLRIAGPTLEDRDSVRPE